MAVSLNKPVKSKLREKVDLLIVNANELVTLAGNNQKPRVEKQMLDLGIIRNGAVAVNEGKIAAVGRTPEITKALQVGNHGERKRQNCTAGLH